MARPNLPPAETVEEDVEIQPREVTPEAPLEAVELPGLPGEPISAEELTPSELPAAGEDSEIVVLDEESMTLINTDTGEVVGVADTPPEDAPAIEIAKWVGDRRDWHKGRKAGLEAERQVHLDKIAKVYDAQINNHTRAMAWIEKQYSPLLFELAKKLIGDAKKRSVAVGMLILKLRKTKASVDVQDNDKAVTYLNWLIAEQDKKVAALREKYEDAKSKGDDDSMAVAQEEIDRENLLRDSLTACLNIKTTVYKSSIPDRLKDKLTTDNLESTGMVFNKGGEEKLEIE